MWYNIIFEFSFFYYIVFNTKPFKAKNDDVKEKIKDL